MNIRLLIIGLLLLIAVLQYKLWFSQKGIPWIWEMEHSIVEQKWMNDRLRGCNRELRAEVIDLKSGKDALEERARNDLGMVKQGEIFVSTVVSPEGIAGAVSASEIDEEGQCEKVIR